MYLYMIFFIINTEPRGARALVVAWAVGLFSRGSEDGGDGRGQHGAEMAFLRQWGWMCGCWCRPAAIAAPMLADKPSSCV